MPSPDSGTSTRPVVSALRAMSSSVCPTPTVSNSTRSKPNASSRSATSSVVVASPPCAPRVAIERMNTPGSRLPDSIRIRSPSSAPPVNGLVGSTATTPTERRWARNRWIRASVSVLLPAPGGPVMPPRRRNEQPGHGLDPARGRRDAQRLLGPVGRGASLQLDDPDGPLVGGGRFAGFEDLRHQVAEQVLERDQARSPAELV